MSDSVNSPDTITAKERKLLDLLRQADAVFIHIDDGMRSWAWIRGFLQVPAEVQIQYGQDEEDKRAVRHLTIKMGLTEKEWKKAICTASKAAVD